MGTIKTTNIEPIADNGTVTLGSSGDTITIPSGVTITNSGIMSGQNYPAFEARLNTNQSISNASTTIVIFDTEVFDTDSAYDTVTGYFTPQAAGKYFIYVNLRSDSTGTFTADPRIKKNNSDILADNQYINGGAEANFMATIIDLNGTTDFVNVTYYQNSGSTKNIVGASDVKVTYFGGYRIGS
jgi:hypothetical protein